MNTAGAVTKTAAADGNLIRPRLKKILRWLLGIVAGLFVLLLLLLVFRDPLFKAILVQRIHHDLGMRAEIGELKTGLGRTVVHIRDFKLFNSPEFGGSLLAEVPNLFVQIDTGPLADRLVHLRTVRVHLAEFNVVRNGAGRTNLEKIEKAWREHLRRRKEKKHKLRWDFAGVDLLEVSIGKIGFIDLHRPSLNGDFTLDVCNEKGSNLSDEEQVQAWASALALRLLAQDALRPPADRKLPTMDWLLGWVSRP
jgi:hypothetical protein